VIEKPEEVPDGLRLTVETAADGRSFSARHVRTQLRRGRKLARRGGEGDAEALLLGHEIGGRERHGEDQQ